MKRKLIFLTIVFILLVGCSSSKSENSIAYTFELNEVFGIEKSDLEEKPARYSTHAVQNGKLLVSRNELNHEFVTDLITRELLLVDLKTQHIDSLLELDKEIRIWDYVLIENGFLYSTVELANFDHSQNQFLKFKVIENIDGKERVLDEGNCVDPFKTPSFHYVKDVVFYMKESIESIDNIQRKINSELVRYNKGSKNNVISIENIVDESNYIEKDSEVLYSTELVKGAKGVGFITHFPSEESSNVYVVDSEGDYTKKKVEGTVTDLMLFENRTVYQLVNLTENQEIESVKHYDLKNDKALMTPSIDDTVGRVVVIDQNTNAFIGRDNYPYLISSNKKDLQVQKIEVEGFNRFDLPFIYSFDSNKLLLVQFPEDMSLKLSIIDMKESQTNK